VLIDEDQHVRVAANGKQCVARLGAICPAPVRVPVVYGPRTVEPQRTALGRSRQRQSRERAEEGASRLV
jgi:hypothetical protein